MAFLAVDLLVSTIEIILTVAVASLLYLIISKIVEKTAQTAGLQKLIVNEVNRVLKIVLGSLAFISILGILGIDITGLVAGVGIAALAVGIAAQSIVSNLISGLFIIFERAFTVGDYIQVGDVAGTVTRIGFRITQVQTLDGRMVVIPNSILTTSNIHNYTLRRRDLNLKRGEAAVVKKDEVVIFIDEIVDYYTDVEKAKELMLEVVREVEGVVLTDGGTPKITVDKNELQFAITLRLFVTVEALKWNFVKSNIIESIKSKFDQNKIIPPVPAYSRDQVVRIKKDLEETKHGISNETG